MEKQDAGFASEAADGGSSTHSGLFVTDGDRPTTPEPVVRPKLQRRRFPSFEIRVPAVKRRNTYVSYPEELVVSKVVGQASNASGQAFYDVKCGDGEYVTVRNQCPNQAMLSLSPSDTHLKTYLLSLPRLSPSLSHPYSLRSIHREPSIIINFSEASQVEC